MEITSIGKNHAPFPKLIKSQDSSPSCFSIEEAYLRLYARSPYGVPRDPISSQVPTLLVLDLACKIYCSSPNNSFASSNSQSLKGLENEGFHSSPSSRLFPTLTPKLPLNSPWQIRKGKQHTRVCLHTIHPRKFDPKSIPATKESLLLTRGHHL